MKRSTSTRSQNEERGCNNTPRSRHRSAVGEVKRATRSRGGITAHVVMSRRFLLLPLLLALGEPTSVSAFTHPTSGVARIGATRGTGVGRGASMSFTGRSVATAHPVKSRSVGHGYGNRSTLSMHMGHSHSHDHDEEDEEEERRAASLRRKRDRELDSKPGLVGFLLRLPRRRAARVAFAGVATLGPPLLLRRPRAVHRSDLAAFVLTSAALSLFDVIRRGVKRSIGRLRRLRDGVLKHTPESLVANRPLKFLRSMGENDADRVTLLGVLINLFLSVGKAAVGVTCHSSALVADAGHSLSDLFSDFITLWAVQIGRLPPDDDHPYGHGKFEAIGSLFLALTLLGTGISVGAVSNRKLMEIIAAQRAGGGVGAAAAATLQQVPTAPALLMAGLSIFSKEWLYQITRRVGEKVNSPVVVANAWHHRSDAYSSVLALISIGLAMFVPGLLAADSAAGLLVAGMICMTGAEILGESITQLTDTTDERLAGKVRSIIKQEMGGASSRRGEKTAAAGDVRGVTRVRTRRVGSASLVDVDVTTPGGMSSSATRAVEERLRHRIADETDPGEVLSVEVRASGPDVVCPLLSHNAAVDAAAAAAGAGAGTGGDGDAGGVAVVRPEARNTVEIEEEVRGALVQDPRVRSVEGVTVHYRDTVLVDVDASVRLSDPRGDVTLAEAAAVAEELRASLEGPPCDVNRASIYLDLNEGAGAAVLPNAAAVADADAAASGTVIPARNESGAVAA